MNKCSCGCGAEVLKRYVRGHNAKGSKKPPVPEREFWKLTIARFLTNISTNPVSECWEWTGMMAPSGYGVFSINGHPFRAHRMSWKFFNALEIPNGLCVLHKCDNPRCVNPAHLWIGTHTDNVRDKIQKGRDRRGERHHGATIKDADVEAIYRDPRNQQIIASEYGISRSVVNRIKNKICWTHITKSITSPPGRFRDWGPHHPRKEATG